MKKKFNLITIILCITSTISCERDSINTSNSNNMSSSDQNLSSNLETEKKYQKNNINLLKSDFDFEANTVMIDVNGDQFPVVDTGEGPVALLIHGWPDSKEMWRYQIPFLVNAGYRVIAPDLRGFGDAPKTETVDSYGLGSLMTDVITILDNMEIDNVNLVTHDWGAALGWTMARYQPDYVNSFITISIGAPGNPGFDLMEQRRQNWYLFMFAQEGMGAYELSTDDWSLFRSLVFHPDEDNIINNLSESGALESSMRPYQANYTSLLAGCPGQVYEPGDDFDIEYPLVSAPTFGILGKYDFAMLEPQMALSKDHVVTGNFEYEYLEDVGHWMMLEKPEQINNMIKDFLDCHAMSNCD